MLQQLDRREFLGASLASGAFWSTARAASQPNIKFPAQPAARLAIASYPFRAYIISPGNRDRDNKQPAMDLKDFAAMVVREFKVHNVELLGEHFPSTGSDYLRELRRAVNNAGAHVVNLPVSPAGSLYDPRGEIRKRAVDDAKRWVDAAVALGSPGVRVHIAPVEGVESDVGKASESLSQIASYAATKNVVVTLENDDPRSEDAFFCVKLIETVASPFLRALPDFCNSMLKGDEKYNYKAVAAMFRHAYNISHVKDSEVDNGKVYRVDMAKTFGIAKSAGYRGYFSMEWEGEADPYTGTRKLIEASLKYLS
jgi:sugar phosphate isomerase/epimerase